MDCGIDFKKIFEDNLDTLFELLRIPSMYDENTVTKDMPYGLNVYKAFDYMRQLAIKDGFNVLNFDNQALTVSYVDKDDSRIDIPSHLDVVSVDDKWSHYPFDPIIKDGKIYARGTADMKTALFISYLALKLLREKHPNTPNEIRLVFGTDEERTMNDMRHYFSKVKEPLFAFSPDGKFPMAIGEKGALMWKLIGKKETIIESLDGGIQCNIVAPNCEVTLKNNLYTQKIKDYIKRKHLKINVDEINNKTHFFTSGKAVHASRSFLGNNAIIKALKIIGDVCKDEVAINFYKTFADPFGFGFVTKIKDIKILRWLKLEDFLTVNLGILKIDNNDIYALVDSRYPANLSSEFLTNKLKEKISLDISLDYDDPPTLCKEDDIYVKTLLDTYREVVDDLSKPRVSGGVSYAKVFKHCVTYGMVRTSDEYVAHQPDEFIRIDRCIEALEIFYKAMEKLAYIKEESK